jgi:hypothetical protein
MKYFSLEKGSTEEKILKSTTLKRSSLKAPPPHYLASLFIRIQRVIPTNIR